jgi:Hypoxia induced protein conserved region
MTSTTLLFIAMAAVVAVLVAGLANLVRTNSSPSLSQNLMRWRVGLQFIAITVAMLMLWLLK